jgi:hypothetical protein
VKKLGIWMTSKQGISFDLSQLIFIRAMFSWLQNSKSFQDSPSHRICRHMYGVLNIGKK